MKLDSRRLIPRRRVLRGGLAGLAAALVGPTLGGCDGESGEDSGVVDSSSGDARVMDTEVPDAGGIVFPPRTIPDPPALRSLIDMIGPLQAADSNGVRVAPGFSARVIATSGQMVTGTSHSWHLQPDGGAVFGTEDGGWIYVSNSEVPFVGGVSAIRFDDDANILDAYPVLSDTNVNCAGGPTPWHTWLSCEETPQGRVYECDPWGDTPAVVRPALGKFKHEAAAIDPVRGHVYLTEDVGDGAFYRYTPSGMNVHGFPNLSAGDLQVAIVDAGGAVSWQSVPDPFYEDGTPTRSQVAGTTPFDGGEGIWFHDDIVYFSTKGDTRVWAYDVAGASIAVIYDGEMMSMPPLRGVDNLTVSCCGDVLVAEDGGSMQIVAILPGGGTVPIMQIEGQDSSEVTGAPAFDPSGTRLYFSSQRGTDGAGITYEISGPFHEPA